MAKLNKQDIKIKRDPDGRVKLKKTDVAYTKPEWAALSIDKSRKACWRWSVAEARGYRLQQ